MQDEAASVDTDTAQAATEAANNYPSAKIFKEGEYIKQ